MTQSNAMASQNLMRQQDYQRAMDSASKQSATDQASVAGQGVTGGAFDVNAANEARMANIGVSAAYAPKAGAVDTKTKRQEAEKTKMANAFGMPSVQGLTFGGS